MPMGMCSEATYGVSCVSVEVCRALAPAGCGDGDGGSSTLRYTIHFMSNCYYFETLDYYFEKTWKPIFYYLAKQLDAKIIVSNQQNSMGLPNLSA